MTPASGPIRSAYLAAVKGLRQLLEGTRLLDSWTDYAANHPRAMLSHLRTLVAVHNADDLVRLDLPWWTYEAIDIVDRFLKTRNGRVRVFEFGSGASTIWLARRSAGVTSVEHDPEWARQVSSMIEEADDLLCTPELLVPPVSATSKPEVASNAPSGKGLDFSAYVRSIDEAGGTFDLILIDGRAREACLGRALKHVGDHSLILLDDAHRRRYRSALEEAEKLGWHIHMTRGSTPCQPLPRRTALLTRSPNEEVPS